MPSPPLNAVLDSSLDATAMRELVIALRAKNADLEARVAELSVFSTRHFYLDLHATPQSKKRRFQTLFGLDSRPSNVSISRTGTKSVDPPIFCLSRGKLHGWPRVEAMNMIGSKLPAAARIDLELFDYKEWEPEDVSEAFVEKIRRWRYLTLTRSSEPSQAKFPAFSPIETSFSKMGNEVSDVLTPPENWNLFAPLPNLERLELEHLASPLILSMPGNIKDLSIQCFDLSLETDTDLVSLTSWLDSGAMLPTDNHSHPRPRFHQPGRNGGPKSVRDLPT